MRRRSERKKSTEVCSTPVSRRTSRRSRKSPEVAVEKSVEEAELTQVEKGAASDADEHDVCDEQVVEPTRRGRARNRTPVKDHSPAKSQSHNLDMLDSKIDPIPEEGNGTAEAEIEVLPIVEKEEEAKTVHGEIEDHPTKHDEASTYQEKEEETQCSTEVIAPSFPNSPKTIVDDNMKSLDVLEIQNEDQEKKTQLTQNAEESASIMSTEKSTACSNQKNIATQILNTKQAMLIDNEIEIESQCETADNDLGNIKEEVSTAVDKSLANNISTNLGDNGRTRKRKWITKKTTESKVPILAISTDSLKDLIADVHPVPLSDVQLESSSEVEEVASEREEGEETPSPDREIRRNSIDKVDKVKRTQSESDATVSGHSAKASVAIQRSPSPPRNQASSVLYITNLVRPFTVLQLKGLLARTGKIVEDGFWIDRIKSKCYVQYETEDEAIETRHALHGVRWPVSNPKCLNVDFGSKTDMERAIQSTKDEPLKFGQDNNKDNLIVGTGWNRDRNDGDDKKSVRPVREWDVGKKESLDREKFREVEKRRSKEKDISGSRENERGDKNRKPRAKGRDPRSSSVSPVRKAKKKENDPPLRLLDDLFRKTKATPCIYWLPLTPEQIAEKEAFRQKRIEEHKLRVKQRELERGKEREKERNRNDRGRERDREREHRRNRSNERRSRSRDRRRYN